MAAAAPHEGEAFRVWSPSSKPSRAFLLADHLASIDEADDFEGLQRTTSGTSTHVPEDYDTKLERTVSEMSTVAARDDGHSSGDDMQDGPSLTPDGRAVDLDAGAPLFFAHDKLCSPSHERKCSAKESARQRRHRREEGLRGRVAAEEVCSLDAWGVVRGEESMAPPQSAACDGRAARLKLFHRKLAERRGRQQARWPALCVDGRGRAIVYLDVGVDAARREHLLRKRAAQRSGARGHASRTAVVAAIDESGRLRRPRVSDFARYLFTLAPEPDPEEPRVEEIEMERMPM